MNTVNEESKSSAIKTLAIIGFIAAVVLGLWITVQVIKLLPAGFSSLASLADSIYGGGTSLEVEAEKDVVNSGEPLRLVYMPVRKDGSYVFSYRCVDGIAAEMRNVDGNIVRFGCDEEIVVASGKLPNVEQNLEIMFTSEKQRFTDVPYMIAFFKSDSDETLYEKSGVVTIVNATIPQGGVVAGATVDDVKPTPVVTKPAPTVKPSSTTEKLPYTKTVPATATSYQTSNPNGFVDLQMTYIGIGEMSGNTFKSKASLEAGEQSALQFSVKNIGTKTSGNWSYDLDFPGEGDDDFSSNSQAPLLPGERMVVTLHFTAIDNDGSASVKGEVKGGNDSKKGNNSFSKRIEIKD